MNNNIQEDYCSSEVSKLLKEKGFGVPCDRYVYTPEAVRFINQDHVKEGMVFTQRNRHQKGRVVDRNQYDSTVSIPTHALAIKWLRENFGINIWVKPFVLGSDGVTVIKNSWCYYISKDNKVIKHMDVFISPEAAIEAALLHTLKELI